MAEAVIVLAIDPGSVESAWVEYGVASGSVLARGKSDNGELLDALRHSHGCAAVVIEQIESFGMAVGRDIFETVYWSGRFHEAAQPTPVYRVTRREVKLHLCGTSRAKDPNVRQALLDRFGGNGAKGTKKNPGPLYGISGDMWAALAVAVTWTEQRPQRQTAAPV